MGPLAAAALLAGCAVFGVARLQPGKSTEADVRQAMAQNRKIFIGPKTIITPSARDAAGSEEVLVMAQR